MKERPILFSGPMVLAILEGRKTQTRRVVKPQPEMVMDGEICNDGSGGYSWAPVWPEGHKKAGKFMGWNDCPYGQPGDRLWVRESWATSRFMDGRPPRETKNHGLPFWYNADLSVIYTGATTGGTAFLEKGKNRPSIHMPRWASRITLEIVAVRVERLQDISNDDARAEGIEREFAHGEDLGWKNYLWHGHFGEYGLGDKNSDEWVHQYSTYADGKEVGSYSSLWQLINGPGSWEKNPFVWVVEFRQV